MRRVCATADLTAGRAVCFEAEVRGEPRGCFVVRTGNGVRAFLNVCAHRNQPVVVDEAPFDEAGLLECRAHGAKYDPDTGRCVEGPCEGARLVALAAEEAEGEVRVADDDAVDDSIYGEEG